MAGTNWQEFARDTLAYGAGEMTVEEYADRHAEGITPVPAEWSKVGAHVHLDRPPQVRPWRLDGVCTCSESGE